MKMTMLLILAALTFNLAGCSGADPSSQATNFQNASDDSSQAPIPRWRPGVTHIR